MLQRKGKHTNVEISERDDRKPDMILYYNSTKGTVDTLDQCLHAYSCPIKTNSWSNKLLFNLLDIGAINAFVVFRHNNTQWNNNKLLKRRLFIIRLCRQLAHEHNGSQISKY